MLDYETPDPPYIENMVRFGTPDGRVYETPVCPICGQETEIFYKSPNADIIGCDNCIDTVDAWAEMEEN